MLPKLHPMGGTELVRFDPATEKAWRVWRAHDGPPVPIIVEAEILEAHVEAARVAADPFTNPRVFRLFMRRGRPRQVVHSSEIATVWRTSRGVLRWNEGGYPPLAAALRKGGNTIIRGDVELAAHDVWWMGREQTDLRILLCASGDSVALGAWWARAGVVSSGDSLGTDGEPWPVRLIVFPASVAPA